MKKAIQVLSLFVLVFALGGCSYKIVKTNETNKIQSLPENNNQVKTQTDIDLQIKCSDAANKFFIKYLVDNDLKLPVQTNHWNKTLGRCLVEISGMIDNKLYYDLFDAIGGQEFAFILVSDVSNNSSTMCALYTNGNENEGSSCSSKDEFDKFVDNYMKN